MKKIHLSLCIITFITTTHALGMLQLETDIIKNDIYAFLDLPDLYALQSTCTQLHNELRFTEQDLTQYMLKRPNTYCFIREGLGHHIMTNNEQAVRSILALPCKDLVNGESQYYRTPLMHACCTDHPEMITVLLDCGADIQRNDKSNKNILHHLFLNGMPATSLVQKLKRITESQAYQTLTPIVNQQDDASFTPLHYLMLRFSQTHPIPEYLLTLETVVTIIKILKKFELNHQLLNAADRTAYEILHSPAAHFYRAPEELEKLKAIREALNA